MVLDGAVEATKSVTVSVRDASLPDPAVSDLCTFSIATEPTRFAFGNVYGNSTYLPPAFTARPTDWIPFTIVNGPVEAASLTLDDFVLTRNGVTVPWPSDPAGSTPVVLLSSDSGGISGLYGLTEPRGTYLIRFTGGATDILGTPLAAAAFTWTNSEPVSRVSGPNGWAIALEPTDTSGWMSVAKTTIAPDGSMIAVGSFTGTVDFDPRTDTAVSLTSSATATGESGFIARYDATGTIISAWRIDAPVTAVAISGTRLMIGGTFSGSGVDLDPRVGVTATYDAGAGASFFLLAVDLATGAPLATNVFAFTPAGSGSGPSWLRNQMDTITTAADGRVFFSGVVVSGSLALGAGTNGPVSLAVPDGQADGFIAAIAAGGSAMWGRRLENSGAYSFSPPMARSLMLAPAVGSAGVLALGVVRETQLGMIPGDVAPADGEALVIGLDAATGAYRWRSTVATGLVEEGDLLPLAATGDGRLHAAAHVWQQSGPAQSSFVTIDPATGSRVGTARNLSTLMGASSAVYVGGLIPRTDGSVVVCGLMDGSTNTGTTNYLLHLAADTGSGTPAATAVQSPHTGWTSASGVTADGRFIFHTWINDSDTFPVGADGAPGRLIPATGSATALWSIRDPFATVSPPGFDVPTGQTATDPDVHSGSYQVVKRGGGTLILDQANSHSGGSVIEAGTVVVRNASALGTGEVRVKAGATLVIDPAAGEVAAGSLVIEEGGFVDLRGGRMLIRTGGSAEAIMALILAGQGDGSWSAATGLGSSAAAEANAAGQQRRIGWLDNGDGSFTVAFAAPGDTNLDGSIDILDVANFFTGGKYDAVVTTAWTEGDYNYDAQADILDIADFFGTSLFDAGSYLTSGRDSAAAASQGELPDPTTGSSASAFDSALVAIAAEMEQASTAKKRAFARLR